MIFGFPETRTLDSPRAARMGEPMGVGCLFVSSGVTAQLLNRSLHQDYLRVRQGHSCAQSSDWLLRAADDLRDRPHGAALVYEA
jgi:hypothetical protein